MSLHLTTLAHALCRPAKEKAFVWLLGLNLFSNCAARSMDSGMGMWLCITMLAFTVAYAESALLLLIKPKWLKRTAFATFLTLHNLLIVVDYFCLYNFQKCIAQDVVDIIAETNPVEAGNFLDTYLSLPIVLAWSGVVATINVLLWLLSKYRGGVCHRTASLASLCALVGTLIWCWMGYSFVRFHNGMSIPQFQTFTRIGYSLYVMNQRQAKIVQLREVARTVKASVALDEAPDVVVIVGESFSVFHSALYGYDKDTSPRLTRRKQQGELAVFSDVVSVSDGTHGAMLSVFSLDSLGNGFEQLPLFPMCFKNAGYHTAMYDNQYFVGGINFLSDKALSDLMFDTRNDERYTHDADMVATIRRQPSPALYVVHLWGQHYTYANRYPASATYFTAKDYNPDTHSETQRQRIAEYDNALRYNDMVVDSIIRMFADRDACVVYFSDHGEEIYDFRDYMGHGNAHLTDRKQYQLRVPLMIWPSPIFRQKRPELTERIFQAVDRPTITDDVAHLLLDIAGIRCDAYRPTRSVINDAFRPHPRIVLNSVDYDKAVKK